MKTCFLFPGQGAQYPGMGKDLWDASDKVKELFRQASDASGMDLTRLLFEGSEEELKATDKTQVAVTLVNVAASLACRERGLEPAGFAGFSLGEYTALYEAGVLRLEDLFPIVKTRGLLMEKASRGADTAGGRAGMAAVIGLGYPSGPEGPGNPARASRSAWPTTPARRRSCCPAPPRGWPRPRRPSRPPGPGASSC